MSTYDLGDTARLAVQVTDSTGTLANATAVTLTVTLPDGTTSGSLTPTNTATGVYQYDYTPSQVGRHGVRWVATGTNAGAFATTFEVLDPAREPLVQPEDLRQALRDDDITDAAADSAVWTASGLVRGYCRQELTRATHTQRLPIGYDRRGWFIRLPQRPLQSVTRVAVNGTTVTTHTVDLLNGLVRLPDGVPTTDADEDVEDQALVTYVAGMSAVPGDVKAVALAVAMRLYTNPLGFRSEQIDDYLVSRAGTDDDLAGVTLTATEKRTLKPYRSAAGSVPVRG